MPSRIDVHHHYLPNFYARFGGRWSITAKRHAGRGGPKRGRRAPNHGPARNRKGIPTGSASSPSRPGASEKVAAPVDFCKSIRQKWTFADGSPYSPPSQKCQHNDAEFDDEIGRLRSMPEPHGQWL